MISKRVQFLPAVRLLISMASYANPVKAKTGTKVAPQKQQFRKRFKEATAAAMASGSNTIVTQKSILTDALFTITNENGPLQDEQTLEERAVISKAWSRMQMLRTHCQSSWERTFLQSKIQSMEELSAVSPELAQAAREIDYTVPPAHRRLPTETPPSPDKFPYMMMNEA